MEAIPVRLVNLTRMEYVAAIGHSPSQSREN